MKIFKHLEGYLFMETKSFFLGLNSIQTERRAKKLREQPLVFGR